MKPLRTLGLFTPLLCLLAIAVPGRGASLTYTQFSRDFTTSSCGRQNAVSSFNTRDLSALGYFELAQLQSGDVVRAEWIAPDGAVPRFDSWTVTPNLLVFSNVCYDGALSSANDPYAPALGAWKFRILVNGVQLASLPIVVASTPAPALTLGGYQTTSTNTAGSCSRSPEKTSFLTTDGSARVWWAYPSIPGRTALKAAFTGPNGLSYSEYTGQPWYDGDWCFWKDFDFTTVPASGLAGKWTVRMTADDQEAFTTSFTVAAPGPALTLTQSTAAPVATGGSYTLTFTSTGSWFVVTNVSWITITSPASGSGNGTVAYAITVNPTPSVRTGTITVGGQTFTVTQAAAAGSTSTAPATVTGVLNGAEFGKAIAPGSLATVFGTGFSTTTKTLGLPPFPTNVNGITITVNGKLAPITYLGPTQINFQVPIGTPAGTATVIVTNNGVSSPVATFTVVSTAPGIFQSAGGRGIIQNQDYTLATVANPAKVSSVITVYLTGIGATSPAVADGAAAPSDPLAVAPVPYSATIGGQQAGVVFLGLTPGFTGLGQANIQVPAGLATGDWPLVITINGRSSAAALIAVQGSPATGTNPGGGNPGNSGTPGLPSGVKCVSGLVNYVQFSTATAASRLADEVSIGSTKLCPTCELKPPVHGDFAKKLEAAQADGLSVDACYDSYGTLNYLRMRP